MGKVCLKCWENLPKSAFHGAMRWCKSCAKARRMLKKYGITPEDYENMVKKQGGKCLVCRKGQDKRLVIDHDHVSGQVRGLLCNNCNAGIGFMQDRPDLLVYAAQYLDKSSKSTTYGKGPLTLTDGKSSYQIQYRWPPIET